MKKHKPELCVYCGAAGSVTADHVPPKNLFPPPRPSDLVTVPACRRCHSKTTSLDDEYFRNTISMRHDVADHPAVQMIMPSIWRGLERPQAIGLAKSLVSSISMTEIFSRGGIYLGKRPAYAVDLSRLNRVAARVVRGMFFVLAGHRLPTNYGVNAYEVSGFKDVASAVAKDFGNLCQTLFRTGPARIIGDKVFLCWWGRTEVDENATFWILSFYTKVFFIAWTGPMDRLANATSAGRFP